MNKHARVKEISKNVTEAHTLLDAVVLKRPSLRGILTPEDQASLGEVRLMKSEMSREAIFHSGPLPASYEMEAYEKILPGSAERIFLRFEKQSDHRMALESLALGSQIKQSQRGQTFAFITAIAFLLCAVGLVVLGHDTAGITIATIDLGALMGVYFFGQKEQKKDLEQKSTTQKEGRAVAPPRKTGRS